MFNFGNHTLQKKPVSWVIGFLFFNSKQEQIPFFYNCKKQNNGKFNSKRFN